MFGKLDKERTRAYMVESHRGRKQPDGAPFFRHPQAVAKLADQLAARYYTRKGNLTFPMDQITIKDIWHAGMLHDAIEHGRTYDDILEVTSLSVANIVSEVTSSTRLPRPRRLMEYCNRLNFAEPPVMITKLAEIVHHLESAMQLIDDEAPKSVVVLNFWPQELVECVEAIRVLRESKINKQWAWCADTADLLDRMTKRWKRRHDIKNELLDAFPKLPRRR